MFAQSGVKGNNLVNLHWLEIQLGGNPLSGFGINKAKVVLDDV